MFDLLPAILSQVRRILSTLSTNLTVPTNTLRRQFATQPVVTANFSYSIGSGILHGVSITGNNISGTTLTIVIDGTTVFTGVAASGGVESFLLPNGRLIASAANPALLASTLNWEWRNSCSVTMTGAAGTMHLTYAI